MDPATSNKNAALRWNRRAVGGQRSQELPGTRKYYEDIEEYRYGYETPFIPRLLLSDLHGKNILEIGVGNGIDGVKIALAGGIYSGIDVANNHIELTKKNFELHNLTYSHIYFGDLLETVVNEKYDIVYSFGVLHHIIHESEYLRRIKTLLADDGELRVALYSKYSFFNFYMFLTWIIRNKCKVNFNLWQGYISDAADFSHPITIRVRSKRQVLATYKAAGFVPAKYHKRGFVKNYIPFFGRFLTSDGWSLNALGAILGWYHVIVFKKK